MSLSFALTKQLGSFGLDVAAQLDCGVLGILGASGSGKSLTLKSIAGLVRPDSGRVELDGVALYDSARGIDLLPQQRQVGYLFQNYALFPHLTVAENIGCGLGLNKKDAQANPRIRQMIDLLQLNGLEGHYPRMLSGGQQQRVALARLLAANPRLLLLDEPFSALDDFLREQLHFQLDQLLAELNVPAILVTHSRDEVYKLSRQLLIIDHGKLVSSGRTADIFAQPGNSVAARLTGCKNIVPARPMGEHKLWVEPWQVELVSALPVPAKLTGIAIRARHLRPATEGELNAIPVQVSRSNRAPFEQDVICSCGSGELWWKAGALANVAVERLSIEPEQVLLLCDDNTPQAGKGA